MVMRSDEDEGRAAVIGELRALLPSGFDAAIAASTTEELRGTVSAIKAERARYEAMGFVDDAAG